MSTTPVAPAAPREGPLTAPTAASGTPSSVPTTAIQQPSQAPTSGLAVLPDSQPAIAQKRASPTPAPPYAGFAILSVGGAIAASATSFTVADCAARGQWNLAPLAVVLTVLCLLFMVGAVKKAGTLRAMGAGDPDVLLRRKKLLYGNTFFAVLFIGTAAFVGKGVGTSGAETNRLVEDTHEMSTLGDRISKARSAAERTVPAQVEMYKSIDADVEKLGSVLGRLREDYAIYDRKFPSQHKAIADALHGFDTGTKRVDLLRQQIAVAKVIDSLTDADAQFRTWQTRMQPLLDLEDRLDSAR